MDESSEATVSGVEPEAPSGEPVVVDPPPDHDCEESDGTGGAQREATAEFRGWGAGWPSDNRAAMHKVVAGGVALLVHREIAPIVEALVNETVGRGYQLHSGQCWGYANRAIAGTNRPSNHSWGLAIDLNSTTNPMGPTLVTDMPPWLPDLWIRRGFRWGGAYRGRKDAMHFEYMGSPADARRVAGEVSAAVGSSRPLLRTGAAGAPVRQLQALLNAAGAVLKVDGSFGPATLAAVKAFQQRAGLIVDGVVGRQTWAALGG
jgi:hypothetical protein